ncbi:MAG: excinuclease ABC subunit C, partial [Alphaproteobacteria bacterium]|nr:excinuclease ABC subunit C [Alphaproteobacteria bacterium]
KEEITRIEVYDNSHISGTNAVGAMIVAGKEGFIKSEYKKFNIRDTDIGDDYQMLREVLTRRLKRLKDKDYTGYLLLIDGGKGQRTIVEEVFSKMGFRLPYLCIAKGKDRNAGREKFYNERLDDITFDKNEEIMKYLQILRDEAHRFAIETHRKLRSKELKTSQLDSIPGIGKFKKAMLLNYFGSVEAIRSASIDDIAKAPGFDKKTAKKIKDALL